MQLFSVEVGRIKIHLMKDEMLWKTGEWAGKRKCYIYPPLSQHS